jgi:adenylate cyclase
MTMRHGSDWALLLLLLPVLVGLVLVDGPEQSELRNAQFDQFQRWYPRAYVTTPVRVVDIDEESLARLGQWPWPRTRMAQLVDALDAAGASVVAFDVMFPEPDRTSPKVMADLWQLQGEQRAEVLTLPDHDAVFARSLEKSNAVLGFAALRVAGTQSLGVRVGAKASQHVVPAQKGRFVIAGEMPSNWLHRFDGAVPSLAAFENAAKGNGTLAFVPDDDGIVRRVPLVVQMNGQLVGSLVSETLRVAQGVNNVVLKGAGQGSGLAEMRIGDVTIPTTPRGGMWMHYRQADAQRYVSAWQVLAKAVPPKTLDGAIVLLGSSAQGLMDLRSTPLGLMPGMEAHAQALEQVLTRHFLQRPSWARGLESLVLILTGLLTGALALHARALVSALVSMLLLLGLGGAAWWAFVAQGLLLDAATPAMGVVLTYLICSLWHHFSSERMQRWTRQAFSRYVSPNRVAYLMKNHRAMRLGGQRQTCSFVFTDLEGFTDLVERLDPAQGVSLLNTYLDQMVAIAFRHEGTLDRIVGDAVAIMFSAPVPQADYRARALACALEMDTFAHAYSMGLQKEGIDFGKTRIGVHSGEVIVGNFGGSTMFDYRAMGDPVNTAARLESVNKHLGTRMCVSEDILADNPQAVVRPVGRLVLKGKRQALAVFEPVTDDAMPRAPLEAYCQAYTAMQQEDPHAAALFARLAHAWPQDPLVLLHHGRLSAGERGDRMVMDEK